MNLERGFSVPQRKGNVWVPATPEEAPAGMQQSENVEEDWEELLGLYTGVLKDITCTELPPECNSTNVALNQNQQAFAPDSRPPDLVGLSCGVDDVVQNVAFVGSHNRLQPQISNPTHIVGVDYMGHKTQDTEKVTIFNQNVAFVGSHNRLQPQISNPTHIVGVDYRGHNTQDTEKVTSFNQNATSMGSNRQNKGDAISPTEVYYLPELMGMKSGHTAPKQMGERITCAVDETSSISLHSQVERNWETCRSDSMVHMQNHILQANKDVGGCNVQQIPTSRLSVTYRPSYNLNLSPSSEEGEYNCAARHLQPGPATPDKQTLQQNNKILQVPYFSIDAVSAKENNKQDNVVLPPQADIGGRECNDFVRDSMGASPAATTTMPRGKQNIEGGIDGEIDLNKTPPQKTPKRRKHRPKVLKEGKAKRTPKAKGTPKAKRTPKPKATENNTPGGNSTTKRKYVRKKGVKTSTDQSTDAANGVGVSNVEPQPKSCKRALNFDLENVVEKKIKGKENDHQADNIEGSKLNLNVDFHSAEKGQPTSSVENVQNICSKGKPTENLYDFIHSVDKITPQEFTVPPTASTDSTLNVLARILNVQYGAGQGMNGQVRHHIGGDLAQILENTSKQQVDGNRQPKHLNMPQLLEDSVDVSEKQESKREYSYTDMTRPVTISQICPHEAPDTGHYNRETREFWLNCLEASRTKHVDDQIYGRKSSIPSGKTTAGDYSEQIQSTLNTRIRAECSKLHLNDGLPYVSGEQKSTFIDLTNETDMVIHPWYMNFADSGNKFKKQVNSYAEQMAHRAYHVAKAQTSSSLTAGSNCHMVFASQRDSQVTKGNENINSPASLSVKRKAARQTPSKIVSKNLHGSGHDSKNVTGPCEYKRNTLSIDFITDRMKDLKIDDNGKETVQGEQNALVPYRGDGAVVPFEVFEPIKKRQPRPKVVLDPETNRLWNLLMGKEGSERAEKMDNGTQKNWEEERKVFRGRADSFIARMHLVQGDRRFTKWKGSVVDSVIGVFLTQNVSDHLSSSAFMSLAAKFPLKSTTTKGDFCQNRGNPSNEHEVIISYPDEKSACHDPLAREPIADQGFVTSSQLSQHKTENVSSGKSFSRNNHTRRKEECMISSQSSSESVSFQASDDIRSSSGSNSEAEDHITGSSFRKIFGPLNLCEEAERIAAFQQYEVQETGSSLADNKPSNDVQEPENLVQIQNPGVASSRNAYFYPLTSSVQHYQRPVPQSTNYWQEMLMGEEERELDLLEFMGKECSSSMTSTYFDTTNGTGIEHAQYKDSKSAESSLTDQQTRSSNFFNHKVTNKQPEQKTNLPTESQRRNGQHLINFSQRGKEETLQESSCIIDPQKKAEAFRQKQDNQKPSENFTPEPTETKTNASNIQSSKDRSTSNTRKRKAEKEKEEPFDWDILRKHVESKAGTKGRSSNALDSLDYEALRNADVREISKVIKERGMNNMLAERMKDFLNRLVKDHGSIDLEWLRDVQPDKAKDYLLSVRGLGLKSVECIRLLTLHHLAFPVDTNVGRIAVRLGWVPLQPLPETLQLHLLEMYPVLESIQKYLWPRLCMLDQETLYELHYQLITFGKVFCTKRQPNCNACPMRGECRHFASAFASARLALPGPEERRIVCSDVPSSSSANCGAVIKPMLLAPGGDNLGRTPEIMRNCEPIIEEPATPEASIEMSERDIEDAFFEDPDEIPEIKLNIEEFTSNLQSFIEEKMEMQEGNMSKALVALSPEFASIPMPKLKQVSRLRTEHQVYELPDSHPLLKGLDKREPDDPSPYLLAIWAPGETADSTEPPESKCSSSKGGPCNTKACFSCNSTREAEAQTVRGTILIPCRTAMRGSFPLNGTYFQVNEVFADNETSMNPIDVPRSFIWNLARRTVFFGTSVSTIFKGMSTEDIQYCFWKGFVCVRGFDQKTRAPRPLKARLHLAASRIAKKNE